MSDLYEQFIRRTLTEEYRLECPRIQVCRQTMDLTQLVSFNDYWHLMHRDLPDGLFTKLVNESKNTADLSSHFVLNPYSDRARSTNLVLLAEHYSALPLTQRKNIEFRFSPIVASEQECISIFYAQLNRDFLSGATLLCIAEGTEPKLQSTRCLIQS